MIRSSWHEPGRDYVHVPIEYCILLCSAGPTVRIVGDLNKHGEPVSARIEHQDWFYPFETWVGNCGSVEKILLAFARGFNFRESGVNRRRAGRRQIKTIYRLLSG